MTMDVLCGRSEVGLMPLTAPLPPSYVENSMSPTAGPRLNRGLTIAVIAAIVYGDESRVSGRLYNQGTCMQDGVSRGCFGLLEERANVAHSL